MAVMSQSIKQCRRHLFKCPNTRFGYNSSNNANIYLSERTQLLQNYEDELERLEANIGELEKQKNAAIVRNLSGQVFSDTVLVILIIEILILGVEVYIFGSGLFTIIIFFTFLFLFTKNSVVKKEDEKIIGLYKKSRN
jgi:hypothetical protein